MNLPNWITLSRIFLVPVFIALFWQPGPSWALWAAGVFLLASLTDWVDGYLARRRGQVTVLGMLLDPMADKLLVLSAVILLVERDRVDPVVAILILGREMSVTGLRALASTLGKMVPVREMGRYKTTVQVVALTLLILPDPLWIRGMPLSLYLPGTLLLYLAVVLALVSGGRYFLQFYREVTRP